MPQLEQARAGQLAGRVDALRARLVAVDNVADLALRSQIEYNPQRGEIGLALFGRQVVMSIQDYIARDAATLEVLPVHFQALILYYLTTSSGCHLTGRWVSFAELQDGRFYARAFQSYTGDELVKKFGNNLQAFIEVAQRLGGDSIFYGDAGFVFTALPRVTMAVVYHLGDEDFPASCKVLFDHSVNHYLPTDVCAVLGSLLTHQLLSA